MTEHKRCRELFWHTVWMYTFTILTVIGVTVALWTKP